MGNSNFTTVGVIEESTLGTTPSSAFRLVNVTDGSIMMERDAQRPDIWTGTQRRYPGRPLSEGGAVTFSAPQQYENTLEWQEGLFGVARGSAVSISAATTIEFTTGTITDSGNGLAVFNVGDLIYITGSPLNSGWKGPVTAVAAGTLTFAASSFTAESAGAAITLRTRRLVEPSIPTLKGYSLENNDTDLTRFTSMKGSTVTGATWEWATGAYATEQYTFSGRRPAHAGATIGTGAATAAKTTPFINTPVDWAEIHYGALTASSAIFTRLGVQANPNVQPIRGNGSLGPANFSRGSLDWTITGTLYNDTAAQAFADDALTHSTKYLWWAQVDPAGNRMAFLFPANKIDVSNIERGTGQTQKTITFTATAHSGAFDSTATYTTILNQAAFFYVPA